MCHFNLLFANGFLLDLHCLYMFDEFFCIICTTSRGAVRKYLTARSMWWIYYIIVLYTNAEYKMSVASLSADVIWFHVWSAAENNILLIKQSQIVYQILKNIYLITIITRHYRYNLLWIPWLHSKCTFYVYSH